MSETTKDTHGGDRVGSALALIALLSALALVLALTGVIMASGDESGTVLER